MTIVKKHQLCRAAACEKPLANGITLCHEHTTQLEEALREVPASWQNIYVSACKLDVGAGSVGGMGGEASGSEPANLDALDKAQTLEVVLRGWAGHLSVVSPRFTTPQIATRLFAQLPWIRRQDWAGDLLQELRDALNACNYATDRAADRISLGPCGAPVNGGASECTGTITAISGATTARCRDCGGTISVHERQAWAISEAWHVRAFLPDIVRWLARSGHARIDVEKAKKWVQRGKLQPVACDMATRRHLFTPASVLAVYRETPIGRKTTAGQAQAA